jgi:ATP-dependent RNA helicase DeaD
VRLFLSIGRKDGFDGRKLVGLLKRECDLRDKNISDVKVADCYSFVTVPYTDAEEVVRRLNKLRKGKRPVAEITEGARAEKPRKERKEHKERPAREERTATERAAAEAFAEERKQMERPKRKPVSKAQRATTERSNDTFDWSYFERGGNSWGSERHGGRGKSGQASHGGKLAKGKKGGRR